MSLKSSIKTVVTLGRGLSTGLPEAADDADPIELFDAWFEAAKESGLLLPEATTLATATPDGIPAARMVLLKQVDAAGFVFYTNFESDKARDLEANPNAALCFHWPILHRQVRVTGTVQRVSDEENRAYFASRPRGSQIGAWASKQSRALGSREELELRARAHTEKFSEGEVPLPPFWGGYRISPARIEFWQGRADRLHDRLIFLRDGESWSTKRLYP
jgi:pyridoxamine 5'-phosphate oxidase